MILRGAIVSTERIAVRLPAEERAETADPRLQAYREPELERSAEPELLPVPQALAPPPERPLDAERVREWLVMQDKTTRRRVADELADEVGDLYAAAKAKGAEDGAREAAARASEETKAAVARLAQIAKAAEEAYADESAQLAAHCADIVAEVLAKVAGPALATRDAALGVALKVLTRVKDERELTLRVAENDVAWLKSQQAALDAAATGRAVRIVADQRVEMGGCIAESKLGSLDARLETQLAELFETIRAARAASGEGA